jgi:hypothetical protein
MNFLQSWGRRIATALGVVLLLVLVVDFNSRMVHLMELRGEMEAERNRLDHLLAEEALLENAIDYAESPEAVAEWARSQNWMGKDDDIVIVPIPNGTYDPEEVQETTEPQERLGNWEAWMLWLTYRE